MSQLRLSGPQIVELKNLLTAAFSPATFDELLLRLDRKLTHFAGSNDPLPVAILKSVERANAELWWRNLLREASNTLPDPHLLTFSDKVGFAPDFVASDKDGEILRRGRELELIIEKSRTTFDIVTWRVKVAEIEGRVCRIEIPQRQARGTGFLIAPDLVMTNYHVIEPTQRNGGSEQVVCRFDYKALHDGVSVGPGMTYGLAEDWLVKLQRLLRSRFRSGAERRGAARPARLCSAPSCQAGGRRSDWRSSAIFRPARVDRGAAGRARLQKKSCDQHCPAPERQANADCGEFQSRGRLRADARALDDDDAAGLLEIALLRRRLAVDCAASFRRSAIRSRGQTAEVQSRRSREGDCHPADPARQGRDPQRPLRGRRHGSDRHGFEFAPR
jgi:hypothetical protein